MENMKGLAITNIGIEDIAASEIKELTGAAVEQRRGCVIFDAKKFEDFFRLCYRAQSLIKVMLLLESFSISDVEGIKKGIQKAAISEWIDSSTTFAVRSMALNSTLSSQEIEESAGEFILEKIKAKVDLERPDVTFFVFVDGNSCYFGIDFSGADLGKRDYRIFTGAESLKPTVAYAMLRAAGFEKNEVLLDPFCRAGTIAIEAALFASSFPVNFFSKEKFLFTRLKKFRDFDFNGFFDGEDKGIIQKQSFAITAADPSFNAITSAKKNAKIAGMIKAISFSRKETGWLELKFKEKSVAAIVSFPPQQSRNISRQQIDKIYNELFYQAGYILKNKGAATLLLKETEAAENAALSHNFKIGKTRKVMQGKEEFSIVAFVKQ